MKTQWVILAGWLCAGSLLHGQGFVNLNFENVTITSSSPSQFGFNYGTANVAGWTEYYGWNDVNYSGGTSLIYNNIPLDSEGVSIMNTNGPAPAIQGRYSILLEGATASGVIAYPWMTNGAAIGQTGQIPSSANSIIYWASDLNNGGLQVSFNGQALSFTDVSNTANYSVWVADISPYAGQTGELLFSTPSPNGEAMLDNIQFSANPAPEPRTLALAALGGVLLGCRSLKKIKIKTAVALTLQAGLVSCFSQGFVNLNFESASISPGTNPTNATILGWTAFYGTSNNPTYTGALIYYNNLSLGGAGTFLEDSNYYSPYAAIQGKYSVLLVGSIPAEASSASVGQMGTIPNTAQSLIFYGSISGTMQATFNGQSLNFEQTSSSANYNIYTADISAYAGQTGQLLFTAPVDTTTLLDNIQFSANPAPEPRTMALAALGGVLLSCRRFQKVK